MSSKFPVNFHGNLEQRGEFNQFRKDSLRRQAAKRQKGSNIIKNMTHCLLNRSYPIGPVYSAERTVSVQVLASAALLQPLPPGHHAVRRECAGVHRRLPYQCRAMRGGQDQYSMTISKYGSAMMTCTPPGSLDGSIQPGYLLLST
jgi:hypothetical protein